MNFLFTFVGLFLVERIGRKKLLLSSLAGVILSLAFLAIGFQLSSSLSPDVDYVEDGTSERCAGFENCGKCTSNKHCGFCYLDISGGKSFYTMAENFFSPLWLSANLLIIYCSLTAHLLLISIWFCVFIIWHKSSFSKFEKNQQMSSKWAKTQSGPHNYIHNL